MWQKSHSLVLAVDRLSKIFVRSEAHGLLSPLQRAAVVVAANITKGLKKHAKSDRVRLLNIEQGSLEQLRYDRVLSLDEMF